MNKIYEIFRLSYNGLKQRQISRSLNISIGVVHKYLQLGQILDLSWPSIKDMDETSLRQKLDSVKVQAISMEGRTTPTMIIPDFELIYTELKRKGVTLLLLHDEYKNRHPECHYSYRRFCELYNQWRRDKKITLRQEYKAGDKMFVDYAGPTIPIIDKNSAKVQKAQIFVAVLAASNYTYVEATLDQKLESWINSHIRAFEHFGGVPNLVIPDNLKSAVKRACKYEPDLNPNYCALVKHYNIAVLPARPYKPQDKSKVENAVLVVERWIMARLRNRQYYSLEDLNGEIKALTLDLNHRKLQKIHLSRRELFDQIYFPALKPLPTEAFSYANYYHRKVPSDYHIEVNNHAYSVPHNYIGKKVIVRVTERIIEILFGGCRIAIHQRKREEGKTTIDGHVPQLHLKYLQWTMEYCLEWAKGTGPLTRAVVEKIISIKQHQDQVSRVCLGLYRLAKIYGKERLELACKRALFYNVCSYQSISNILENNLDQMPLEDNSKKVIPLKHANIRGSIYYCPTKKKVIPC